MVRLRSVQGVQTLKTGLAFGVLWYSAVAGAQTVALNAQQLQSANIQTAQAKTAVAGASDLKLSGTVVSTREGSVAMAALEPATVVQVYVDNLSRVKQGEAVLRVRSESWIRYQQEHLQAYSAYSIAKRNAERDQSLFADGLIPQRRLMDTQSQLQIAQASYQSSRQRLGLMGAGAAWVSQLEKSGQLSADLILRAPSAGQVSGLELSAGQQASAGQTLLVLNRTDAYDLILNASPAQAKSIDVAQTVSLTDCQGKPYDQARVLAVGSQLNAGSQSVPVRVGLKPARKTAKSAEPSWSCLRLNQFVEAVVAGRSVQEASAGQLNVPAQALVGLGAQTLVFVKSPQGFEAVEVKVLGRKGEQATVGPVDARETPLKAGVDVAVSGTVLLKGALQGLGKE